MRLTKPLGLALASLLLLGAVEAQHRKTSVSAGSGTIWIGNARTKDPSALENEYRADYPGLLNLGSGDRGSYTIEADADHLEHALEAVMNHARRNGYTVDFINGNPSTTKDEVGLIDGDWPVDSGDQHLKISFDKAGHLDMEEMEPPEVQVHYHGYYTMSGKLFTMGLFWFEGHRIVKLPNGETRSTLMPNSHAAVEPKMEFSGKVLWITKDQLVIKFERGNVLALSRIPWQKTRNIDSIPILNREHNRN